MRRSCRSVNSKSLTANSGILCMYFVLQMDTAQIIFILNGDLQVFLLEITKWPSLST